MRGKWNSRPTSTILAPVDLAKSNGAILYDVNNRGNRVCLGQFNGGGGDDFLLRQGFIVVWSGWIAELLPGGGRLLLDAPIATENGQPITGLVRAEFVSDQPADRYQISHFGNHGSYPPTEAGLAEAVLTWRLNEADPRVVIPQSQWKLHREYVEAEGRRSLLPKTEIEIAGGIQAGFIYELVYEAHGPIVHGLGLAGIRDLISHFKHADSEQNPLRVDGNPVARFAYGFGVSQSGRCLRQLLYDGFNADEQGRIVFDGVIPHVAGGGMGFFNHRFASPTRHNTQHDNHLYPADVFPFTYGTFARSFHGPRRRNPGACPSERNLSQGHAHSNVVRVLAPGGLARSHRSAEESTTPKSRIASASIRLAAPNTVREAEWCKKAATANCLAIQPTIVR